MTAHPMNPATVRTPVRAVVHAGGTNTAYLRAGHGKVVVLVAADLESCDVQQMLEALSLRFLVLAAAPAISSPAALTQWFHDFAEGLGLPDAHLLLLASVSAVLHGEQTNA